MKQADITIIDIFDKQIQVMQANGHLKDKSTVAFFIELPQKRIDGVPTTEMFLRQAPVAQLGELDQTFIFQRFSANSIIPVLKMTDEAWKKEKKKWLTIVSPTATKAKVR